MGESYIAKIFPMYTRTDGALTFVSARDVWEITLWLIYLSLCYSPSRPPHGAGSSLVIPRRVTPVIPFLRPSIAAVQPAEAGCLQQDTTNVKNHVHCTNHANHPIVHTLYNIIYKKGSLREEDISWLYKIKTSLMNSEDKKISLNSTP